MISFALDSEEPGSQKNNRGQSQLSHVQPEIIRACRMLKASRRIHGRTAAAPSAALQILKRKQVAPRLASGR